MTTLSTSSLHVGLFCRALAVSLPLLVLVGSQMRRRHLAAVPELAIALLLLVMELAGFCSVYSDEGRGGAQKTDQHKSLFFVCTHHRTLLSRYE